MRPLLLLALLVFASFIPIHGVPLPLDPTLFAKGEAVYEKLKHDYPDAPMPSDADLAPHTIDLYLDGSVGRQPIFVLAMPVAVWNKLGNEQRQALVALVLSKIREARMRPESFARTTPSAPVYTGEIANIKSILDNAWEISVGHLDSDGYLVEDEIVLKGSDYGSLSAANPSLFVYANSKDDSVYNSALDGSVLQVKDYHNKFIHDPTSIQYSAWTKVIKTGLGYEVSVTFTSEESGSYVLHDQTIDLDGKGNVTKVRENNR